MPRVEPLVYRTHNIEMKNKKIYTQVFLSYFLLFIAFIYKSFKNKK